VKTNQTTRELGLVVMSLGNIAEFPCTLSFVENIFASGRAKRVRESEKMGSGV
jgi:hypothetical protein